MANRIWHYHFGHGIVGTPSDFGVMGDRPSNPQLLDYLASSFVENGWSIKKLHRMIMLSNTYQESSATQEAAAAVDPENKLHWRYERHRAEGEIIRDAMLDVSGKLNLKMGGPGISPPLPPGAIAGGRYSAVKKETDPTQNERRSVYIFAKRYMVYPMLDAFDAPNPQETCGRRFRTVIPSQSLVLMNDALVAEWSMALASRVLNDAGLSPDQEVERAYRLVLSRSPKSSEKEAVNEFLREQSSLIEERLVRNEKVQVPGNLPGGVEPARAAAFADFCHALLNTSEFLYVN